MILDSSGELLYPCEPWSSPQEEAQAKAILSRYVSGGLRLRQGRGRQASIGNTYLYIMSRTYIGRYDEVFVVRDGSDSEYTVLAYIDITPIALFLKLLNSVLLVLVGGLSLFIAVVLVATGRGLDRSFGMLKEYISAVGERRSLFPSPPLPYKEFNEITDIVFQMSRRLEDAEASQVKFFQNASHELRTPLTSIRGYAEGIASGVIKDCKGSAAAIIAHSDRMSVLVDELLYTSKLDLNSGSAGREQFDLRETAARCIWSIRGEAERAGLRLVVRMSDDSLPVIGNEEMIQRAVSNILSNALRYAENEISVLITGAEGMATIVVEDDGGGIAAEDMPHIFERFYSGRGGVTGLGLSITHDAVQRHGGSVSAETKDGKAVFTLSLPLISA